MASGSSGRPGKLPVKLLHTLSSHKGPVHTAVFNSSRKFLLTGGQDRKIKLWNPFTANEMKEYSGHGYEVLGLACSKDNASFASCGGDKSVFVWDVTRGETTRRFQGHSGKVNAVAFNEEATILASASFDTHVRLWDMKSQQRMPLQILEHAKDSVTSVLIQGHLIVTGSVDGYTRTYDIRSGQLRTDFFDQPVTSVSLSTDSAMLLVSTLDSKIRCMDIENGHLFQTYEGHKNVDYRSKSTFGVNGATVVFGDEQGEVFSWDLETSELISRQRAHDRAILWTTHHPSDNLLITASADGTVKVFGDP